MHEFGVGTNGPLSLRWHRKALEQERKGTWREERDRSDVLSNYTCLNLVEACMDLVASAGLDSDVGLKGVNCWAGNV